MEGQAMTIKIRQASRFDACDVLGEVISETSRAYIFRRPDGETGFISKNAPTLHVRACTMCADHHQHQPLCEAA
jgi:hypothetical protein